jgi:type I restriction enzyme S subunit
MKTTWVKLSDVCETTSGGTPSRSVADYYGGDIPWVKSGELLDDLITDTEEKITKAGLASSSAKLFPAGTLLIALYGATVGRLGILGIDSATNQAVCGITPNEQLDRDFLFYYLLKQREKLIDSRTGGAQPNISQEIIRELDIPLPPLTKQKRIASLLARADRLRQLRRTAHDLSDSVLQSVFLEMFGDGFGKWKVDLLENLTKKIDYGVTASAVFKPVGSKFLRITDIQEGKVNWDDVPYCEISEKERDSSLLSKGDIVFARTGATTGKSFLIHDCPENSVFASYLIRVRSIEELNPVFLFGYFQTAQYWKQISESATGSTQPGVNSTKLGELKVPVPPLSLQEEFAGVVARVESLRGRMGESTRQVEGLFESLLAEAFS